MPEHISERERALRHKENSEYARKHGLEKLYRPEEVEAEKAKALEAALAAFPARKDGDPYEPSDQFDLGFDSALKKCRDAIRAQMEGE